MKERFEMFTVLISTINRSIHRIKTEEMLPEYYKQFIDHLLENGIVFDEPKFL